MTIDPRLILQLDTQAPARTGAAIGVMNDPIPALKLGMGLQELQNQQTYRQAQLEQERQQTALRQQQFNAANLTEQRKEAERKAGLIIPFVSMMAQNPTEEGLGLVTQRIAAHPELGPEKAAAFAQTYRALPVDKWAPVSRMELAGTPEGTKQAAQAAFPEPGKDTGQWSDPYQLGGATVQKNTKTGEIRTAVSRPPVTNVYGEQGKPPTGYRWKADGSLESIPGGPGDKPARALPTSAAQAIMANQQNLRRAEQALALIEGKNIEGVGKGDPKATGLWTAAVPDVLLNRVDPAGTDTRAAIADLGSLIIHDRSGAAVTVSEYPRLRPFIPLPTDKPEIVSQKLKRFVTEYRNVQQEMTDFYSESGYNVPSETLRPSGANKPPPSPSGGLTQAEREELDALRKRFGK